MADYSSTGEIVAIVQHLMGTETTFNDETTPTGTQVTNMQNRISGVLNMAFSNKGFAVPINTTNANSTAKLACDNFVVLEVAQQIELAHPSRTFSGDESRVPSVSGLIKRAKEFVESMEYGLKVIGATQTRKKSDGLTFTGLSAHKQRTDPDDNTIEQPKFSRRLHDAGSSTQSTSVWAN
jgi:hypothetical protein